jgi:hypothetical protein
VTKTKPHLTVSRDDPEQSRFFIKKAREIEAETTSAADELLGKLAKQAPEPKQTKRRPKSEP